MIDMLDPNLLGATYAAGLDHKRWPDLLALLGRQFNHLCISLRGYDLLSSSGTGVLAHNYDHHYIRQYDDHYSGLNPWDDEIAGKPALEVQRSENLLPTDSLKRSAFYNEWLRPQEDIGTGAGVTLLKHGNHLLRLSCNMRFRDQDKEQQRLVQTLHHLAPHMLESLRMGAQLRLPRLDGTLRELFEMTETPVALVGLDGTLKDSNAMADRAMLGHHCRAVRGQLSFVSKRAQTWFEKACADLHARRPVKPFVLASDSRPFPEMVRFSLFPFSHDRSGEFSPYHLFTSEEPVALLVQTRARKSDDVATVLAGFSLSGAEIEIARQLLAGESAATIADTRRVSVHTVRNQVQSILSKSGVSRQNQFIAMFSFKTASTRGANHEQSD